MAFGWKGAAAGVGGESIATAAGVLAFGL